MRHDYGGAPDEPGKAVRAAVLEPTEALFPERVRRSIGGLEREHFVNVVRTPSAIFNVAGGAHKPPAGEPPSASHDRRGGLP